MGYWDIVRGIVKESDIVMEIIDSRFPDKSRNHELEEYVRRSGKKLLVVINKSDLISKRQAAKAKEEMDERCVFVSARFRSGIKMLRIELDKLSSGVETKVAVTGYPNTGKSSVINMLKGRKAARTSPTAGFTKGKQFVRMGKNTLLIDTPGVIPLGENDETLMALLSSKNAYQLHDLEGTGIDIAEYLLKSMGETLTGFYGVEATDGEEFLEKLALKRNKLKSGARPDINSGAMILIEDFQRGKIVANPKKSPKKA